MLDSCTIVQSVSSCLDDLILHFSLTPQTSNTSSSLLTFSWFYLPISLKNWNDQKIAPRGSPTTSAHLPMYLCPSALCSFCYYGWALHASHQRQACLLVPYIPSALCSSSSLSPLYHHPFYWNHSQGIYSLYLHPLSFSIPHSLLPSLLRLLLYHYSRIALVKVTICLHMTKLKWFSDLIIFLRFIYFRGREGASASISMGERQRETGREC